MKKILIFLFILVFIKETQAHPLDISSSFFSIKENKVNATTYLHTYEVEYLLSKLWKPPENIMSYYKYEDIIKKYLKENIFFSNNWKNCNLDYQEVIKQEEYEIVDKWLQVNYIFSCEEKINSWKIKKYKNKFI